VSCKIYKTQSLVTISEFTISVVVCILRVLCVLYVLCVWCVLLCAPECEFFEACVFLFVDAWSVISDVYCLNDFNASGVTVRVDDGCVLH